MIREEVRQVKILDARDKQLRNKTVHLVKVQWQGQSIEEETWEREEKVRAKYPELFENFGLLFLIFGFYFKYLCTISRTKSI